MIVLHIHDIIRYSQKKMTEKYILYIHFKILDQTCGNKSSFCIFKDKKNKHNAELQRTDRGTKVTKGRIFPCNAQNGFLLFPSF